MNNYVFFTGAPGSRWSGVSQVFRDTLDNVDNSDLVPEKSYKHHLYSGHIGNYYGPGMLNAQWLDQSFGTQPQWETEIAASYTGTNPVKLILSHHFAYWLNQLTSTFPTSKVVLCYRTDQECYDWWHTAGGWNIAYPNYSWYENNDKMLVEIQKQNKQTLEFISHHNLTLEQPTIDFFRQHFDINKDFNFSKDVKVAVFG
jgi:hypothetical protein